MDCSFGRVFFTTVGNCINNPSNLSTERQTSKASVELRNSRKKRNPQSSVSFSTFRLRSNTLICSCNSKSGSSADNTDNTEETTGDLPPPSSWENDPLSTTASAMSSRLAARLAEAKQALREGGAGAAATALDPLMRLQPGVTQEHRQDNDNDDEGGGGEVAGLAEDREWERWLDVFHQADEREQYLQALQVQLAAAVEAEKYADAAMLKGAVDVCQSDDPVLSMLGHFNQAVQDQDFARAAHLRSEGGAGLCGWWLARCDGPPSQTSGEREEGGQDNQAAFTLQSLEAYDEEIRARILAKAEGQDLDEEALSQSMAESARLLHSASQAFQHHQGQIIRISAECGRFVGRVFTARTLTYLQETASGAEDGEESWDLSGVPVMEVFVERTAGRDEEEAEEEKGEERLEGFNKRAVVLHSAIPQMEVVSIEEVTDEAALRRLLSGETDFDSAVETQQSEEEAKEHDESHSQDSGSEVEGSGAEGVRGGAAAGEGGWWEGGGRRVVSGGEDFSDGHLLPAEGQMFYSEEMTRSPANITMRGLHEFIFHHAGPPEDASVQLGGRVGVGSLPPLPEQQGGGAGGEVTDDVLPRRPGGGREGGRVPDSSSDSSHGAASSQEGEGEGEEDSEAAEVLRRLFLDPSGSGGVKGGGRLPPHLKTGDTGGGDSFSSSFTLSEDALDEVLPALAPRTTFTRIDTTPPGPDVFSGLYVGQFGPHGPEVVRLQRGVWGDDPPPQEGAAQWGAECVTAFKLSGDAHVPSGAASFRARVGRQYRTPHHGVYPEELGVLAAYKGEGRVAELGFQGAQWVPGELLHLDGRSDSLGQGASVGFVWTVPGERRLLILFSRIQLPP